MDDKKGWVKLYRKLLDSALWKDCNAAQKAVLVTLLLMADHSPSSWVFNGKEYKTEPGQMVTSLSSIAEKAGVSISQVRRSLMKFEKFHFSTGKPTNKNRLVTIENWALYQGQDEKPTGKPAGNRQATDKQPTTNKNIRIQEYKNTNKDILSGKPDGASDDFRPATDIGAELPHSDAGSLAESGNSDIPYREIVNYLNVQTGHSFRADNMATKAKIKARWKEGYRLDDFKSVIDSRFNAWGSDERMSRYLRPLTLFGPKFEGYLEEAKTKPKHKSEYEAGLEDTWKQWDQY